MIALLTGATGFFGREIIQNWPDVKFVKLSRKNSDINTDLSVAIPEINDQIDLVIHAAGKAHMNPKTKTDEQEFYNSNVNGTSNLLKGLENSSVPKSFVFISSVAVYGKETGQLITEDEPLAAENPYGLSKIEAEKLILSWCQKKNVICTILRLPLIAGKNPPGNLGAMIRAIKKGYYFNIEGGKAKKSMVLAEDIGKIIFKAADIGGIYNLTDGYHPSFYELSSHIEIQLHKKKSGTLPYFLAMPLALIGDIFGNKVPINSIKLKKIISDLTFDDSKARLFLGWDPMPVLKGFKIS